MNTKLIQQTIDELNDYLVGDETKSNLQITLNRVLFDLAYRAE